MWTTQRVQQLTTLWASGLSGSAIASEMGGLTRNAVIGKANRLQLPTRTKKGHRPPRVRHPRTDRPPRPRRPIHPDPRTPRCYRAPRRDDLTKNQLRAMLADAVRNTAALSVDEWPHGRDAKWEL